MNLIRFGSEVLNLELIKRVEFVDDKNIIIYFSLTTGKDMIIYKGKDAKLLRRFFEENSRDITQDSKPDEAELVLVDVVKPDQKGSKKQKAKASVSASE